MIKEKFKRAFTAGAFSGVFFVMGFIAIFPNINMWLVLKNRTGLDPGKLQLQMVMIDIPWLISPLYAWISDRWPIRGFRRKSYIILFSLICSACWFLLPVCLNYLPVFYCVWMIENIALCWVEVGIDSLMVERIKKIEDRSLAVAIQTTNSTCLSMGKCFGSILGMIMMAEGAKGLDIFYVTAVAPLILFGCGFYINEKVNVLNEDSADWRSAIWTIIGTFKKKTIFFYCVITVMYSIVPDPGSAYLWFYEGVLKIPNFGLQMLSLAHEVGLLVGKVIFVFKLREAPPELTLKFATILVVACNMCHPVLAFSDFLDPGLRITLMYFYEFLTAIADEFLYLPFYIMGARICSDGLEATTYEVVHSIRNFGNFGSSFVASYMMQSMHITSKDMSGLWRMSYMCSWLYIIPLYFTSALPTQETGDEKKK